MLASRLLLGRGPGCPPCNAGALLGPPSAAAETAGHSLLLLPPPPFSAVLCLLPTQFFLQNYRLGKTLGIGSFGKVGCGTGQQAAARGPAVDRRSGVNGPPACTQSPAPSLLPSFQPAVQVKVAEHILTGHKVAIKILNRKKIKQMDMEEKGAYGERGDRGRGGRSRRSGSSTSASEWGAMEEMGACGERLPGRSGSSNECV